MKTVLKITVLAIFAGICFSGCAQQTIFRPARLYNTDTGNTIELVLEEVVEFRYGRIVAKSSDGEKFKGEYVVYPSRGQIKRSVPLVIPFVSQKSDSLKKVHTNLVEDKKTLSNLAKLYGFGENANPRPKGIGMIVGENGTAIEIVFYTLDEELLFGDGIALDNNDNIYRVFLRPPEDVISE